ncbi:MAG TPA: site-specific integrase [bacterium]|nr:site-specific integrase [bacterium]
MRPQLFPFGLVVAVSRRFLFQENVIMACIEKKGNAYRIQYYYRGKKYRRYLAAGISLKDVHAEKARIEASIARDKAGLERFNPDGENQRSDLITLAEMFEQVLSARKYEVSRETWQRFRNLSQVMIQVIGPNMPVKDIRLQDYDRFRTIRYQMSRDNYVRKGWKPDENKSKTGVNKDLRILTTLFRCASRKGIINKDMIPEFEYYKTDYVKLPKILNATEVVNMANELDGEARLAFWIYFYTGFRRQAVARETLSDTRALKWENINWMTNEIRIHSKRKDHVLPMHPRLRDMLLDHKKEIENFDPEDFVIHLTADSLTKLFRRAMDKLGIKNPSPIHSLRHTFATDIYNRTGDVFLTQELTGHSRTSTLKIYADVAKSRLQEAVANREL